MKSSNRIHVECFIIDFLLYIKHKILRTSNMEYWHFQMTKIQDSVKITIYEDCGSFSGATES